MWNHFSNLSLTYRALWETKFFSLYTTGYRWDQTRLSLSLTQTHISRDYWAWDLLITWALIPMFGGIESSKLQKLAQKVKLFFTLINWPPTPFTTDVGQPQQKWWSSEHYRVGSGFFALSQFLISERIWYGSL